MNLGPQQRAAKLTTAMLTMSKVAAEQDMMFRISLIVLLMCALGCASEPDVQQLPCIPTRGELYIGGVPAGGAELLFQPQDADAERWIAGMPHATVNDDGTFQVGTYQAADGAPEGEYIVLVKWMTVPNVPKGERPRDDHMPYDRLLGKHYNPATAKLRAKVSSPETRLPRFQL